MKTAFKLVVGGILGLVALMALGVPLLILLGLAGAAVGLVAGLAGAALGLVAGLAKLVLFIAIPVLLVGWLVRRVARGGAGVRSY